MADKDCFGIITNSNERFEKERNKLFVHRGEMNRNLKILNEVMGNKYKGKKDALGL